jgi:hypothetical protein
MVYTNKFCFLSNCTLRWTENNACEVHKTQGNWFLVGHQINFKDFNGSLNVLFFFYLAQKMYYINFFSCKSVIHNFLVSISYGLLCRLVVSWGSTKLNIKVCMFNLYFNISRCKRANRSHWCPLSWLLFKDIFKIFSKKKFNFF